MTKLAYKDLAYMENVIASQNRIMRLAKLLNLTTEDLEVKEALADIYLAARDTKQQYIDKMHELQGKDVSA